MSMQSLLVGVAAHSARAGFESPGFSMVIWVALWAKKFAAAIVIVPIETLVASVKPVPLMVTL
jgi:hypothetical protein